MKNNKLTLLPGLSLFVCFCLLTGTGRLAAYLGGGAPLIALAELISFVLPFFLVKMSIKEPKTLYKRLKYKQLPKGAIGLTVKAGITVAVLSLFLNLLIYQLAGLAGRRPVRDCAGCTADRAWLCCPAARHRGAFRGGRGALPARRADERT